MKKLMAVASILALALLTGCSEQARVKAWGGATSVTIPEGAVLLTMTWKESNLWILYYDPKTKSCVFSENSAYGLMQGVITVPNCNPAFPPSSP